MWEEGVFDKLDTFIEMYDLQKPIHWSVEWGNIFSSVKTDLNKFIIQSVPYHVIKKHCFGVLYNHSEDQAESACLYKFETYFICKHHSAFIKLCSLKITDSLAFQAALLPVLTRHGKTSNVWEIKEDANI